MILDRFDFIPETDRFYMCTTRNGITSIIIDFIFLLRTSQILKKQEQCIKCRRKMKYTNRTVEDGHYLITFEI
jgi:hypothetical protein